MSLFGFISGAHVSEEKSKTGLIIESYVCNGSQGDIWLYVDNL